MIWQRDYLRGKRFLFRLITGITTLYTVGMDGRTIDWIMEKDVQNKMSKILHAINV